MGVVQSRMGDVNGAIATYRQVTALDPKNAKSHELLGALLLRDRPQEALRSLQQAAELAPKQGSTQVYLGAAWFSLGRPTEGLAAFERAAQLEPRNAEIQLQVGKIWKVQGDTSNAIRSLQRAISLKPSLVEAQSLIGDIYLEQQDFLSAIITYRQLVSLDPGNPQAHYKLATALRARNRLQEAADSYQQAQRLYQQQGQTDRVQEIDTILKELKKS